ncbi:hypothetical protein HC231_14365 [Brenneria izadpanahii]|uniref:Uncharacterized protein n=1 Tax=Brenneria izadpanahii TaxID=2722756 RepID=A0ABX7UT75_9GAMM|nr:hypothetical protein [Brenneria izadpanahii]QTF08961.1 hypothetical protein HC231_14365 [Brenneria izadpanahii]
MSILPRLPCGWEYAAGLKQQTLQNEYETELPQQHSLHGVDVAVIAYRERNDDILLRHTQEADRVSVVHLTWTKRTELANFPRVEFTGSADEFIRWEFDVYGVGLDDG